MSSYQQLELQTTRTLPEHRGFANVAAANKADQIPEVVVVGMLL